MLNLTQTSANNNGDPVTFAANGVSIDLLNQPAVLGGGTYTVEIIFRSTYNKQTKQGNTPTDVTDPNNSNFSGFRANFKVIAPPFTPNGGTTTWISNSSTASGVDWLNAANWSNGVPTRFSNAVIPDKVTDTSTPLLASPNATYEVKTLTLSGTTGGTRALLRIGQSTGGATVGATLRVYGDLNCYAGGILAAVSGSNRTANPATNSTLVLARNDGDVQAIRGSIISVQDIRVEGRGIKAMVATQFAAPNTLIFAPDAAGPGAILRTASDNAPRDANNQAVGDIVAADADSYFPLNTTLSAVINLKDSGTLSGEVVGSYVQGAMQSDRSLTSGIKQTFGNIGLDITPNRNIPAPNVVVTRVTGDPLRGPVANSSGPSAVGNPQPVKRWYGVSGDVNNNTTSTIVFHYLNSADELNGITEENLTIFKTANGAPPFTLVSRTGLVDVKNHTVTRVDYPASLNTLTLGDEFNPLPVELVAFNAVRNAANTLLTWTTASEKNNKGFNVQIASDGVNFRTLGFVASQSPNSAQALNYKYTDTEAGKTGTRYYRLEQVDEDGKVSYSPVRAVNFNGAAATSVAVIAYPNPFSDTIGLTLEGATTTEGTAYIKLL
ncbi:MAG: hypothetical protein EOO61_11180, partial [Hymenobacter sp.]